mmetsp:Transcript_39466/g.103316  ORF Transcript_39466/g.103316 Transcript_39466/m.103316 type:complete len:119 (-) Transcript_39466:109-465(-)
MLAPISGVLEDLLLERRVLTAARLVVFLPDWRCDEVFNFTAAGSPLLRRVNVLVCPGVVACDDFAFTPATPRGHCCWALVELCVLMQAFAANLTCLPTAGVGCERVFAFSSDSGIFWM